MRYKRKKINKKYRWRGYHTQPQSTNVGRETTIHQQNLDLSTVLEIGGSLSRCQQLHEQSAEISTKKNKQINNKGNKSAKNINNNKNERLNDSKCAIIIYHTDQKT